MQYYSGNSEDTGSVCCLTTRWHSNTTVKEPMLSSCHSNVKVRFSLSVHSLLLKGHYLQAVDSLNPNHHLQQQEELISVTVQFMLLKKANVVKSVALQMLKCHLFFSDKRSPLWVTQQHEKVFHIHINGQRAHVTTCVVTKLKLSHLMEGRVKSLSKKFLPVFSDRADGTGKAFLYIHTVMQLLHLHLLTEYVKNCAFLE